MMKHQDEYRNPALGKSLAAELNRISTRPVRLMEICGTHTVSIFRHGLRSLFPKTVTLVSGPGCPVCVTSALEIDRCIKLASIPGVHVATFGDLIRVPGSRTSLKDEKAAGASVSVVYSPLDAIGLAQKNPHENIVLLGVGFETTAPTVAATVKTAARLGLENFSVFAAHKLLPPAMDALLSEGELDVQGFICPGHVTTIIGTRPYEQVAARYGTPCVVTGFEPVDILQGVLMLTKYLEAGRAEVGIQYTRGVSAEGNPRARAIMAEVYRPVDAQWRGLGVIPGSGLGFREEYAAFDAGRRFDLDVPPAAEPKGCRCGDVLRGAISPAECPLFRRACRPEKPVGPCMVSSEGACAAYYKYAE